MVPQDGVTTDDERAGRLVKVILLVVFPPKYLRTSSYLRVDVEHAEIL